MSALEQAREALEAGERLAALEHLLMAWREVKAPAIAHLIDLVSTDVARAVPALNPTLGRRLYQEAWLDLAGRGSPADLPRLLEAFAHPPLTDVKERLARLEARPDDPRIAARLARLVKDTHIPYEVEHLATPRVFRLLERIGDSSVRATLEEKLSEVEQRRDRRMSESAGKILAAQLRRTLASLPKSAPPVVPSDAAELEQLAALARAFGAKPPPDPKQLAPTVATAQSEEQLLEQIYAAPHDDEPRRVYSDWLLERGDPRGEFIALQFKAAAGSLTRAEQKRQRELLKLHRRTWLGPIEPVVTTENVEFDRGFLSAARAQFRTPQQREMLLAHPAWNTLRCLHVGPHQPDEFLIACDFRGLKQIAGPITLERFHQLASRDRPYALESLELDLAREARPTWQRACAQAESLPKLTRLKLRLVHEQVVRGVPEAAVQWTWSGALGQRLTEVEVSPVSTRQQEWLTRYSPLPNLRTLQLAGLPGMTLTRERSDAKWRALINVGRVRSAGVLGRLRGRLFGQTTIDHHTAAWLRAELPPLMPLFESTVVRCYAQSDDDAQDLRALLKTLELNVELEVMAPKPDEK